MAGYSGWQTSSHLSTTYSAVFFRHLLNVNMVSSSFEYYRDCFLLVLSERRENGVEEGRGSADFTTSIYLLSKYMLSKINLKALRKRAGVSG